MIGRVLGLLVTALLLPASALAQPQPAPGPAVVAALPRTQPIPPALLETFIDGAVVEAMRADRIAGVAVSVVQDGRLVLAKGYGVSDPSLRRLVDPARTLFRIASISKTFTWLLMAQQIEADRYTLDTPVNDLLPPELRVPDEGFDQPIRVRHLMTHTAGFEDEALGQLFERDPAQIRPMTRYLAEERPDRVRPPGQVATYSNYAVGLAGAIVERVGGRPYPDLVEERLLNPLAMTRTTVREPYPARAELPAPMPAALAADVSAGFAPGAGDFDAKPFQHVAHVGPVGGFSTTATDMARYMLAILNGGTLDAATIYGPATARGLQTTMFRPGPGVAGWTYGFGEITLPGDVRSIGHGGSLSHFQSNMAIAPELRLGVFVSANTTTGGSLANSLPAAVVERFYAPRPPAWRPGVPAMKEQADAYEGAWMSTRRTYEGLEKFVTTFNGVHRVSVTDEGRLLLSGPGRATQWVPAGQPGAFVRADRDEYIAFDLQDGRAVRGYLPWGGAALDRAPFHRTPDGFSLFGGATLLGAALILAGAIGRFRKPAHATPAQRLSALLVVTAALLWFAAAGVFGSWVGDALSPDSALVIYDWPGRVAIASALALTAAVLTLGLLALLPAVWRTRPRADTWSPWRKLRHTVALATFSAFAIVLALNGALEPWSG